MARAVFGADPIESGEIVVQGVKRTIRIAEQTRSRTRIGYLSEDRKRFGLAIGMDVESNIVMSTLAKFLSLKFFLRRATYPRDRAGISSRFSPSARPRRGKKCGSCRAAISRRLSSPNGRARLRHFFFDEPTRGIDVGAKSEIYKLLRTLADEGKAIVMISSELPEVLQHERPYRGDVRRADYRRTLGRRKRRRNGSCNSRRSAKP